MKNNTQIFSVSKEFEEVIEILNNVPNKSRFICEAIIEKYNKPVEKDEPCEKLQEEVEKALLKIALKNGIQLNPLLGHNNLKADVDNTSKTDIDTTETVLSEEEKARAELRSKFKSWC